MSTEGERLQASVLPYMCSICPPLVTRQISHLAILAKIKTRNAFFPVHAMFRHDCPLAVKPASTPRRLVHKKLGEILYLLICSFLLCLLGLLCSWVRKFRRNLWITLYIRDVPGVKVTTSGFNSTADSESKTSYTHGSNSQRFRSYEFLKYSK